MKKTIFYEILPEIFQFHLWNIRNFIRLSCLNIIQSTNILYNKASIIILTNASNDGQKFAFIINSWMILMHRLIFERDITMKYLRNLHFKIKNTPRCIFIIIPRFALSQFLGIFLHVLNPPVLSNLPHFHYFQFSQYPYYTEIWGKFNVGYSWFRNWGFGIFTNQNQRKSKINFESPADELLPVY